MDADSLQNFAVPVQPIQFSTFANSNLSSSGQNGQSTPAVSAYADPTESSMNNLHNGTSPSQRRSQSVNAKIVANSSFANRSPQSVRKSVQPRASLSQNQPQSQSQSQSQSQGQINTSTPSRNASVVTTTSDSHMEDSANNQPVSHFVPQPSTSQGLYNNLSSKGSSLVWKNSSSAFPSGTPRQATKPATSVYTTPQGLIHSDPWSARHSERHGTPGSVGNNLGDEEVTVPANPFNEAFPLVTNPPNLQEWREKLFNISDTLILSEEEFLTYFPHVDNVYSHRSTQKYKRKAFVSHYWDCRLKGRPSGTPKSDDPNKKKRKRQARERDLCDVKIKVTEYFSAEEARTQGLAQAGINDMPPLFNGNINPELLAEGEGNALSSSTSLANSNLLGLGGHDDPTINNELTIIQEDGSNNPTNPASDLQSYGLLELPRRYPKGHPGADGKRWYTIQRVRGNPGGGAVSELKRGDRANDVDDTSVVQSHDLGDDGNSTMVLDPSLGLDLDHKHSLEESDRIKKNSIHRWLLKEEKEKKRLNKLTTTAPPSSNSGSVTQPPKHSESQSPTFRASGMAFFTARSHSSPVPSKVTFFANSFCPFAQRVWIALEIKGIPYQMVEVMPPHLDNYSPTEMLEVNPDGNIPCVRHGNWGVWESGVIMEYLEDLAMGHALLPLGNPQLRAHCRLWTDHINRKILPSFYSLLLTPPPSPQSQLDGIDDDLLVDAQNRSNTEQHTMLVATLQRNITSLVNASHATGPYFLGSEIGYVDVVFAPWIIRLSRVLSYYRNFPRPEVGTRWRQWVDAIESDDRVRRTVSDENSYHGVYRGVGEDGWDSLRYSDSTDENGNENGPRRAMVEITYAKKMVAQEGFGLGGDVWGHLGIREDDVVDGLTTA